MPSRYARRKPCQDHPSGFTLVEAIVGIALFAVIGVSLLQAFVGTLHAVTASRIMLTMSGLLTEQMEIVRNLPYADVGVTGGIPNGKVPYERNVVRSGLSFTVRATIRNVDDPFDGTLGGAPNDSSPADYKFVELQAICTSCDNIAPSAFSTYVAPRSLETASTNGALFIHVLDANGQPVPSANVSILNAQPFPAIAINDVTDTDGWLRIVDAPPGVNAYEITVTKAGHTTDRTYLPGAVGNPNPAKPHATVALQQVTQISFAIDDASTIQYSTVRNTCAPVGNTSFTLSGSKLIGSAPDVRKYDQTHATGGAGTLDLPGLEWDTYISSLLGGAYDLAGSIPVLPFTLPPGSTQSLQLVLTPSDPRALLVTVLDASTQLPVTDASVHLTGPGVDETLTTGRGYLTQTDWSGGPGQNDLTDATMYFDSDGNVAISSPAGELRLAEAFGTYLASGSLISSTFDTGSASNFHQILWSPTSQPPETGTDAVRFQIATNDDNSTWDFIGPDGTSGSYYTLADNQLHSSHDGDRYLRYLVYLRTDDTSFTPNVSDISFTFTSSCVPPGQVLFGGLAADTYTVEVSKSGYQTYTNAEVSVSADWSEHAVTLSP